MTSRPNVRSTFGNVHQYGHQLLCYFNFQGRNENALYRAKPSSKEPINVLTSLFLRAKNSLAFPGNNSLVIGVKITNKEIIAFAYKTETSNNGS